MARPHPRRTPGRTVAERRYFSARRLRALACGAPAEREEMAELVRLARLGQRLENDPAPPGLDGAYARGSEHTTRCYAPSTP